MANTGYFCFLIDSGNVRRADEIKSRFGEFVQGHASLKNLDWYVHPYDGPQFSLTGMVDRLTPANMREFMVDGIPAGVRVFIVNSTYGDEWEEVT